MAGRRGPRNPLPPLPRPARRSLQPIPDVSKMGWELERMLDGLVRRLADTHPEVVRVRATYHAPQRRYVVTIYAHRNDIREIIPGCLPALETLASFIVRRVGAMVIVNVSEPPRP